MSTEQNDHYTKFVFRIHVFCDLIHSKRLSSLVVLTALVLPLPIFIIFITPQIPSGYTAKCYRHVYDLMKTFGNESNLPRQVFYFLIHYFLKYYIM